MASNGYGMGMGQRDKVTRRTFLERSGATAAGIGVFGAALGSSKKTASPNDKIVFGLIACGAMGSANMRNFMGHADVEVAAICDVDDNRMTGDFIDIQKKYGRKPDVFKDYRRMLERKDIDAIIVGTPDHWHALNLIHAVQAGKDVYCEKPVSHNIVEAVSMVGAARRHNRVVSVGTWQRSDDEFKNAIAYVRSGKLGKVVHCRAWIADGTRIGNKKPVPVPSNLDYDMWIGPAKMVPYQENLTHWNWRWMMNTGGGLTTDWGVHMMDIALLGMSKSQDLVMPVEVSAYGGQWVTQGDDRDAPDTIEAIMRFQDPDWVMTWSVLRDHPGKPGHCTEFVGADGRTVRVWRGGWTILGPDGKELPKDEPEKNSDHWRDFLDCVKGRGQPAADLASVAQTTIVCHLVNASLYSGRPVRWDKGRMDLVGEAGRATMAYEREYRAPWRLPRHGWNG
jgi:predicted dehydrogenase